MGRLWAWRRRLLVAALALVLPLCCLAGTFCSAPLPAPEPLDDDALPPARPPAQMALVQLPTGITHRSAAFAYRGGGFLDRRDFVMTAVLVVHPRGDVLIDTGFGRDIEAHLEQMPLPFRMVTRYERGEPAADQLDAAGYDRSRLRGIVLTHAHWDHVSGVADFPGTPVLVTARERRFIAEGGSLAAVARGIAGERPWVQRTLADADPAAVREHLRRMAAIAARFPELTLVPAHDGRGFAGIPTRLDVE